MYYHKTSFDFSIRAKNLLLSYFQPYFNKKFFHAEAIDEETIFKKNLWLKTIVAQELSEFLKDYDCDLNYHGITFFVSNSENTFIGNPHIDSLADKSINNKHHYTQTTSAAVRSRFSVMILGDPLDNMTWWNHVKFGDPNLVTHKFNYLNGQEYYAQNIPGNSVEERWAYLQQPSCVANNFWIPSAFIKTDCAHTVSVSPVPRLMVTVPFNKTIEEIVGNVA